MRKVCFFNYMHNGDVFNTKAMVQALMAARPDFDYSYALNCHPDVVKDLCPHRPWDQFPHEEVRWKFPVTERGGEILVNTWIGGYADVVLLPGEEHANYPGILRMWQQVFAEFDAVAGTALPVPTDVWAVVPTTDWSAYNRAAADAFIAAHPCEKRLLMSNGPVRSHQSSWGDDDMRDVIHQLADRHPDWQFVCTQGFVTDRPNVYFTVDVFAQACDINEIAYLSRSCDLIWGKVSGPYMFCHVRENIFDPRKIFFSSSDRASDSLPYGCDGLGCHYYHSLTADPAVLAGQIEDVMLRSAGRPPLGSMIVLD